MAAAPEVKLADVKWRVQGRPSNGRVQYVPYVDATTVARLLDEWVTPFGWKDDYQQAHGKGLWCHLSVKSGDEWVTKKDVGVPSNMEAEKGLVSDAFKRCASIKWGVARNVYDLPTLWAPCDERANRNGEKVAYPNDKTLPAIIAELHKRGFEDAAAADATTDHDDDEPQDREGGAPLEGQGSNGGETSPSAGSGTSPGEPAQPALATFDDHSVIRREIAGLDKDDKKRLTDWWNQQRLPNIKDKDVLTAGEAEAVLSFLDELHEQREAKEPGSTAKEIAERHAAPKGPADRAAGDAA